MGWKQLLEGNNQVSKVQEYEDYNFNRVNITLKTLKYLIGNKYIFNLNSIEFYKNIQILSSNKIFNFLI